MPSSQNDIGLFANVLTERKQEQIDLADGLVHALSPPTGLTVAMIVVMEAEGGAFRYTAQDSIVPTAATGMLISDTGAVTWIPADISVIRIIRNGTDSGKVNVAYYTFALLSEV